MELLQEAELCPHSRGTLSFLLNNHKNSREKLLISGKFRVEFFLPSALEGTEITDLPFQRELLLEDCNSAPLGDADCAPETLQLVSCLPSLSPFPALPFLSHHPLPPAPYVEWLLAGGKGMMLILHVAYQGFISSGLTAAERERSSEQGGKRALGTSLLWGEVAVKGRVTFGQRVQRTPPPPSKTSSWKTSCGSESLSGGPASQSLAWQFRKI